MSLPISQQQGRRAAPVHPLPAGLAPGLQHGRVHEICGPSRVAFALMILSLSDGPVIWAAPSWLPERPYSCGIRDHLHPGRLILVQCRRAEDIQWAAEEALRSGTVPAVLAEYPEPPGLTAVRRLHLAAQTPAETGAPMALGLVLTPGTGGAQGVESRWQATPLPSPSGLLDEPGIALRVERMRARQDPPQAWRLTRNAGGAMQAAPVPQGPA